MAIFRDIQRTAEIYHLVVLLGDGLAGQLRLFVRELGWIGSRAQNHLVDVFDIFSIFLGVWVLEEASAALEAGVYAAYASFLPCIGPLEPVFVGIGQVAEMPRKSIFGGFVDALAPSGLPPPNKGAMVSFLVVLGSIFGGFVQKTLSEKLVILGALEPVFEPSFPRRGRIDAPWRARPINQGVFADFRPIGKKSISALFVTFIHSLTTPAARGAVSVATVHPDTPLKLVIPPS